MSKLRKPLILSKKNLNITIWYIVLILFCSDFLGVGQYIPILLIPYLLIYAFRNKFSKFFMTTLIVLGAFSIVYSLFLYLYGFASVTSILVRLVYPTAFLLLGYKLFERDQVKDKQLTLMIIAISIPAIYGFFSFLHTISVYGGVDASILALGGRAVIDLWQDYVISATGLNSYLSLGLAVAPLLLLKRNVEKPSKFIKVYLFIIFIISAFTAFSLANRTAIVIVVFSFAAVLLFSDKLGLKKFYRLILLAIAILLSWLLFYLDIFNLKTMWQSSSVYARFLTASLGDDPRLEAWLTALKGLFINPLGGRIADLKVGYAHNLWLDIGYEVGIVPFFIMLVFTALALLTFVKVLKNKTSSFFKGLVISLFVAFFITFMIEPIMQGLITYFTLFCFIIGGLQRMLFDEKKANLREL